MARARPHLRSFLSFDDWARRALGAEVELAEPEVLDETLFAPIRRVDGVICAEVIREGVGERRLSFRASGPIGEGAEWIELRGLSEKGLSVAIVRLPDTRVRAHPEVPALVIRRRRGAGPAASLEVRVAYAYPESSSAATE